MTISTPGCLFAATIHASEQPVYTLSAPLGWVIQQQPTDWLAAGSQPPSQVAAQGRLLALWVRWLFSELVIPLIRAHFYCTESEAYRQEVLYFR